LDALAFLEQHQVQELLQGQQLQVELQQKAQQQLLVVQQCQVLEQEHQQQQVQEMHYQETLLKQQLTHQNHH